MAREKSELEERYREEKGQPEACFIEEDTLRTQAIWMGVLMGF